MANWLENKIGDARRWFQRNSPGYQALTQRSLKPIGRAVYDYTEKQKPLDAAMMGMARAKSFTPQEIAQGSQEFSKMMRHYRPYTKTERMMEMEASRSRAMNNLARFRRINQENMGIKMSPEMKFRHLMDLYKK